MQTVAAIENTKSMLLCGFEMSVSAIQQYKIKKFRIRKRLKDYLIKVIICMSEFLIKSGDKIQLAVTLLNFAVFLFAQYLVTKNAYFSTE